MQALIVLLVLYLIVVLLILPIWTFLKIGDQRDQHDALQRRLDHLEAEVEKLRAALKNLPAAPARTETPPASVPVKPAAALAPQPSGREAAHLQPQRRAAQARRVQPGQDRRLESAHLRQQRLCFLERAGARGGRAARRRGEAAA